MNKAILLILEYSYQVICGRSPKSSSIMLENASIDQSEANYSGTMENFVSSNYIISMHLRLSKKAHLKQAIFSLLPVVRRSTGLHRRLETLITEGLENLRTSLALEGSAQCPEFYASLYELLAFPAIV